MPNTMKKIEFYGPNYITVEPSACTTPISEYKKNPPASKIHLLIDIDCIVQPFLDCALAKQFCEVLLYFQSTQ